MLRQRESEKTTTVSSTAAIPHIVIDGDNVFRILIARRQKGVVFSDRNPVIKAVFVIVSTKYQREIGILPVHLSVILPVDSVLERVIIRIECDNAPSAACGV